MLACTIPTAARIAGGIQRTLRPTLAVAAPMSRDRPRILDGDSMQLWSSTAECSDAHTGSESRRLR